MLILSCLMLLLALAGIFLFQGNVILGIGMAVFAVAILVVRLALRGKIPAKLMPVIYVVCILGYVLCGSFSREKAEGNTLSGYEKQVEDTRREVTKLLEQGKTEKADAAIQELQETYGKTDEVQIMKAEAAVKKKEYGSARSEIEAMADKESADYYLRMAEAYGAEAEQTEDNRSLVEKEAEVLLQGAKKHPDHFILNYKAGCTQAQIGNFGNAEYFLLQALYTGSADEPYTPFWLACVYDDMGDADMAYAMMRIAEERGAFQLEECKEDPIIPWYQDLKKQVEEAGN